MSGAWSTTSPWLQHQDMGRVILKLSAGCGRRPGSSCRPAPGCAEPPERPMRAEGSRPAAGSSSIRKRGSCSTAWAMARRWRRPRDKVPGLLTHPIGNLQPLGDVCRPLPDAPRRRHTLRRRTVVQALRDGELVIKAEKIRQEAHSAVSGARIGVHVDARRGGLSRKTAARAPR